MKTKTQPAHVGHTPGPLKACTDTDGRHLVIPIMASWECDSTEPYHPLIAQVLVGKGHAPKAIAIATAERLATAYNQFDALTSELMRLRTETTREAIYEKAHDALTAENARLREALEATKNCVNALLSNGYGNDASDGEFGARCRDIVKQARAALGGGGK